MADQPDPSIHDRHHVQQAYFSPLATVRDFFQALGDLRGVMGSGGPSNSTGNKRLLEVCERVSECGEGVVLCLEQQMRLHNRANETAQEISGVFRLGLHRLRQVRTECDELKLYIKELQLADHGLDARAIDLREKQQSKKEFTMSSSGPIPRAVSYEDFRKHRDHRLSSKRSVDSTSVIRKAKSESDVAMQSLKKKVDSLSIDNTRLRVSEKKLLKTNIKLNRQCKTLEEERDRAEDRLKIEQTQRDSIEKLRQKNKELEDQLRRLCETQVIKEREKAAKRQQEMNGDAEGRGEEEDQPEPQEEDQPEPQEEDQPEPQEEDQLEPQEEEDQLEPQEEEDQLEPQEEDQLEPQEGDVDVPA